MSKFVKLLFACALIAVAVSVCTTGAFAKKHATVGPYVVTNDDVSASTPSNSATVYSIGSGGALTLVTSLKTGGSGNGGGYFAMGKANVAHSKTQACSFISDGNPNTSTATIPDVAALNLATLKMSGPYPAGSTDNGTNYGVGLADAGKYLVAGFSGNFTLTIAPTIGTYSVGSGCVLKYVGSIPGAGLNGGSPDGIKATPNGKYVVAAYSDGSVGSYSIGAGGKLKLIGQELTTTGIAASGVDITKDGKWAIFGDASGAPSVDIAPISANGALGPTVNYFYVLPGANSNNVLLSPDETVLFVTSNSTGEIGAVQFDKTTGVLNPKNSCSSNVLRDFYVSWDYAGGLAFASTSGGGAEVYVAEWGFPSSIGIVDYTPHAKGEDEFCDLTETSGSPASDTNSEPGLLSVGAYPPRPW